MRQYLKMATGVAIVAALLMTLPALSANAGGQAFDAYETYYETLTQKERAWYDEIAQCLEGSMAEDHGWQKLPVKADDPSRFEEVMRYVLYDHPEWAYYYEACKKQLGDDDHLRIYPVRNVPDPVPDGAYERLADELSGSSSYETAKNVFLHVSKTVAYEPSENADTDVGAYYEGRAHCQGVCMFAKRLYGACNIPCVIVTGRTDDGGYHACILIRLGDEWYLCDPTGAIGEDVPLPYFCMTKRDGEQVLQTMVASTIKKGAD